MASLLDLRRRIRSVKNIQQITRAMKMIAAGRLRRAQEEAMQARPYSEALRDIVSNLAQRMGERSHPLLEPREEKRVLLVVVTGDKGLCGSFNTNVIRRTTKEIAGFEEVELLLLGNRASEFFKRREIPIRDSYTSIFSGVDADTAQEIASDISAAFTDGEYDAVYVVYNQFVSVLRQDLKLERLLPLQSVGGDGEAQAVEGSEYIFEPAPSDILEAVVESYVGSQIFRVLLESQASEHAARMTAMDSATRNAGELIDSLTLSYNRSRQTAITTELIEVVSGAQALQG